MKFFTLFFSSLFIIQAQAVEIYDDVFREFLQREFPSCFDGDELNIACDEILNTEALIVDENDILDYDGLQYFTGLKKLVISGYTGDDWGAEVNLNDQIIPQGLIDLEIDLHGDSDNGKVLFLWISDLPESIERLSITNSNDFASAYVVRNFPSNLKYLNFGEYTDIRSPFPNEIDTLIGSWYTLDLEIPNKVRFLELGWYGSLFEEDFPAIPESVKHITLRYFHFGGSLPVLPEGLESLILSGNTDYVNSDLELPSNLKNLSLEYNYMESWPILPESLISLSIYEEPYMDYLPCLPKSLEDLSVISSPGIDCIPNETDKVKATVALPLCPEDINNCRVATGLITKSKYDFQVYPNPASNSIQFSGEIQANTVLRIVDLSGKLVRNYILDNIDQELDISSISKGMYIVEVEYNKDKGFQKLIIQ